MKDIKKFLCKIKFLEYSGYWGYDLTFFGFLSLIFGIPVTVVILALIFCPCK
jgi:hypothetical protein